MKLRRLFVVYLVAIHIIFIVPSFFLLRDNRLFLFAIEGFYFLSFAAGFVLIRRMSTPFDLMTTGSELIEEEDFISTFRETGHAELDRLISLFNTMLVRLRKERLMTEEQHLFLERLIDVIPSGIIVLDYDCRIASLNPGAERLLGITEESCKGRGLNELSMSLMNSLEVLPVEGSDVLSFRGNRRLKCFKSQFVDRGFTRTFILIEEMTEEIRKSEKGAYDKLIRLMSHEVNNSAGAVGSLLQSCRKYEVQMAEPDRDDFTNAVDVSITRLKNLNTFMKQYADIIRLPMPKPAAHDLPVILKQCAALFSRESGERGIDWTWDIPDHLPAVRFDLEQMEQVLVNIFKNSMEAIGSRGTIAVNVRAAENGIRLAIADTGSGIDPGAREHLFSPFFSTKPNGQGIGLTLIREILERHGFMFSLETVREGLTEFSIIMPIVSSNPTQP